MDSKTKQTNFTMAFRNLKKLCIKTNPKKTSCKPTTATEQVPSPLKMEPAPMQALCFLIPLQTSNRCRPNKSNFITRLPSSQIAPSLSVSLALIDLQATRNLKSVGVSLTVVLLIVNKSSKMRHNKCMSCKCRCRIRASRTWNT